MPLSSRLRRNESAMFGNVAGDFLRPELGVARFDFELLDVDRGVVVFLDQLFADQDGVFKVVAAPGHERHQHVAAQSQFAEVGAGAVGQHLGLGDPLSDPDDGLLVDAGVLVRALELGELVDVGAHLARKLAFVRRAFHAHDDALGIHRIHHAGALAEHHRAGIAGRHHAPCRCPRRERRRAAAARPGAACSIPSTRGWRRRFRGTESGWPPPRRAASG